MLRGHPPYSNSIVLSLDLIFTADRAYLMSHSETTLDSGRVGEIEEMIESGVKAKIISNDSPVILNVRLNRILCHRPVARVS